MAGWVYAGMLDELWEGEILAVTVDAVDLVLCNIEGGVVAYDDRCPHLANPLSKGSLDGHVLTCAAHEWVFDARTGLGVNPATACLRPFPVRIDGDTILVNLDGSDA
ncbi:MAG TPA: Rieske 2Fe-2S domain-containing protein [Acidimicrobiia bacterium]|jgi:toluene monooxygenase system ferredoxin subunit